MAEKEVGRALDHLQDVVGRGRIAVVAVDAPHEGTGQHGVDPGGGIDGAGRVEHEHRHVRVVLLPQCGQRLLEPWTGVADGDDGHDGRSLGIHGAAEASGRLELLAVLVNLLDGDLVEDRGPALAFRRVGEDAHLHAAEAEGGRRFVGRLRHDDRLS